MKKQLLILVMLLVAFASCKKDENVIYGPPVHPANCTIDATKFIDVRWKLATDTCETIEFRSNRYWYQNGIQKGWWSDVNACNTFASQGNLYKIVSVDNSSLKLTFCTSEEIITREYLK